MCDRLRACVKPGKIQGGWKGTKPSLWLQKGKGMLYISTACIWYTKM